MLKKCIQIDWRDTKTVLRIFPWKECRLLFCLQLPQTGARVNFSTLNPPYDDVHPRFPPDLVHKVQMSQLNWVFAEIGTFVTRAKKFPLQTLKSPSLKYFTKISGELLAHKRDGVHEIKEKARNHSQKSLDWHRELRLVWRNEDLLFLFCKNFFIFSL